MPPTAAPTTADPTPADLATARATRAWGGDASARLLGRFAPAARDRITAAGAAVGRATPEAAWQDLLAEHAASCRFEPGRVHPTWLFRAFEPESPAVQWAVAAQAPEAVRAPIRRRFAARLAELGPADGVLFEVAVPNPEAVAWALALWGERLVGGPPATPDDPPVVQALATFRPRDLLRLACALGQAKHAFAVEGHGLAPADEARAHATPAGRVRVGYFRRAIGRPDPRLAAYARLDLAATRADRRRFHAALGLVTVARLLKGVDPHRARWAAQHLPYPIARRLGELGEVPPAAETGLPARAVRAWESWILEAAWARLLSEGRLDSAPMGGRP